MSRFAAGDGDQELLGIARERYHVAVDVAELLELGPVLAVPAFDRRACSLEQHPLEVGDADPVARDLVGEVRAEEQQHVALLGRDQHLVVADPVDRVGEDPDQLLARLGVDVRDVLRAGRAHRRHHARVAGEAAADVERLPRALLFPLPEAERDATRRPNTDLLTAPGIEPPTFRMTRRSARPMVAFARPLWPGQGSRTRSGALAAQAFQRGGVAHVVVLGDQVEARSHTTSTAASTAGRPARSRRAPRVRGDLSPVASPRAARRRRPRATVGAARLE